MRRFWIALAAVALVAVSSCRRDPLVHSARDAGAGAGTDVGAPPISDAADDPDASDPARSDAPIAPGRDALSDAAADVESTTTADASGDATRDATPAVCPADEPPLDVCGCGCCGGVRIPGACYYPARGETRAAIPNPMPSPQECANNGCDEGRHYICCADPGVQPRTEVVCARDTSLDSRRRFTITRRDADACTTLELGSIVPRLEISGPTGYTNIDARRGPCDGSSAGETASGGLGRVAPINTGTLPITHYEVHVVLFFDNGTGVAQAVRIDADDVVVAPPCAGSDCPVCGLSCAFDTTYGFTTIGGLAAYRDATILAPPASFTYLRRPEAVAIPEMSCAPAFPACGGGSIDVADVMAAFADPDVQAAFGRATTGGTTPFFGEDQRGGDGPAFQVLRGDGGGTFLVGAACPSASNRPCTPIPAGVSRLIAVLGALNRQQLVDASCAFARP